MLYKEVIEEPPVYRWTHPDVFPADPFPAKYPAALTRRHSMASASLRFDKN